MSGAGADCGCLIPDFKKFREILRLRPSQLANELGITRAHLYKLETRPHHRHRRWFIQAQKRLLESLTDPNLPGRRELVLRLWSAGWYVDGQG